jgi:hypothetical protein
VREFLSLTDRDERSYKDLVQGHEIAMSRKVIKVGMHIDCMLPTLRGIDWRRVAQEDAETLAPNSAWGGDPWNSHAWYGRTLQPIETLLYKWNRVRSLDVEIMIASAKK